MEARQNLIAVADLAYRLSDGRMLLQAYYYLADLDRQIGKNSEALNYTLRAYEVADTLGLKSFALQLLNGLGIIDLGTGNKARAFERFKEYARIAYGAAPEAHRSIYLQNLSSVALELGKYQEALQYQKEASRLAPRGTESSNLLKLDLLKGKILFHLGRTDQARQILTKVAKRAKAEQKTDIWLPTQIQLARLEMVLDKIAAAKARLARITAQIPEQVPYVENLEILCILADLAWQSGDTSRAIAIYRSAIALIASQTHRLRPGTLSTLSGVERQIFSGLARAYFLNKQVEQALLITESARDLIVKRKRWQVHSLRQNQPDPALRGRLAALDSVLLKMRLLQATSDSATAKLLLPAPIRALEQKHAALLDSVLGTQPSPLMEEARLRLGAFQETLRVRNELAFSFFVGDSSSLVFFIAPDTIRAASIGFGRQALEQKLLHMYLGLSVSQANADTLRTAKLDTVTAHELYRALLQHFPIENRLESAMAIVPDDVLHALPFEMLVISPPAHRRAEFLIERFAVRYGSTLIDLQQDGHDYLSAKSFLLAAAPALQRSSTNNGSNLRNARWASGTVGEEEAEIIRGLVKCRTDLTGAKLTRDSLLLAMQRSNWLHIASHCYWQPTEPLFGEIVLSIPPGGNDPERLFAFEVFQMNLPARMAVLSGCETVRGTFIESEGFEGFVQAFRAAGTPSVIASFWKVDDYPTSQFFKAYYEALRAGQSTVRALQTAKLEMLHHPNYDFTHWAAFAYYGRDWRVELPWVWSTEKRVKLVGAILLLLVIAAGLVWRFKQKPLGTF